ncbi:metallophosphoesterase [Enhygromyxa salina]|uniref:Putative metallophosphoesterase n=1 Tax=Enhygromyxa salina TaxID=215803 RepID=A0A2S9YY35_9BACT|nr:metallophosphoesterase [Enhygromyxa salina]PRQ10003.1 putative metallophosphoesterase [Enhygromyxa salina]
MQPLWIFTLLVYAAVVGVAVRRELTFGIFTLVVLGLPTWAVLSLTPHVGAAWPLLVAGHLAAALHLLALLLRPRLRPAWFRASVSIPGLGFAAASMLALPWLIAASLGFEPTGIFVPFALAALGTIQTLYTRETTVDFVVDSDTEVEGLIRYPAAVGKPGPSARPLTLVQITDPHLGPYMSVARLRRICERTVARDPDLVLITGDIMTMESQDEEAVVAALAPLAALPGRVFACHGNHDLEARRVLERAYARVGARLLIDEAVTVQTPAGAVELLGLDFVWRGRNQHIDSVIARFPRTGAAPRIVLLHDPGAFAHLPSGHGDLVLSGHTHGGQLGLLSLGLPHTFVSIVAKMPDHGPWALGRNRLYVHRAQGVYGFPIRLGVPGEQSLMRVHF